VYQLAVVSGKGGTGKTTLSACFAVLARDAVLADCDVDAANLGLVLSPTRREQHEFWASEKASIDRERCNGCGLCRQVCRSGAITSDLNVNALACEGCRVCHYACPEGAISMRPALSGHWYLSTTPYGVLVHARLQPGAENSGRLVALVREQARQQARATGSECVLIDGPPGTGCPVIAALTGVTCALVVTEPSCSGHHDLERVIGVCRHFQVPAVVCINQSDISEDNCRAIEEWCREQRVEVAARIPHDPAVNAALARGVPAVVHSSGATTRKIRVLWQRLWAVARGSG
jgi:MinD superfamily P-loop ATPase